MRVNGRLKRIVVERAIAGNEKQDAITVFAHGRDPIKCSLVHILGTSNIVHDPLRPQHGKHTWVETTAALVCIAADKSVVELG